MVDTNNVLASSAYQQALDATGLSSLLMGALPFMNMVGQYMTSMHAWRWLTPEQAHLKAHGNVALSTATWTEATRTLTQTSAFANYTFVEGHQLEVTGGTGATAKFYNITSKTDSNGIVLDTSLSTAGGDLATGDIGGTLHAPTIELPSDFGSIVGISATDTLVNGMELVTTGEIQRLRTNQIEVTSTWSYRGVVIHPGNPPRPVLDVYPDFENNTEDQFVMFYKRGWDRLTSLEQVLKVPDYMIPLYYVLVRAWALGFADEDIAPIDTRLDLIERGGVYRAAREMDWRTQPHFGRMTGGMVARTGVKYGPNALATEVGGPT